MKPNWENLKLKSKEEGIAHVIKHLFSEADRITSKGLTNTTTILLGDTLYTITGKKRKKK